MKETFKNTILVTIVSAALIIACVAFFMINAFYGNPISKNMAQKNMIGYLDDKYNKTDFIVYETIYDLSTTGYKMEVSSKTSPDTNFTIYYKNGKIEDSYQEYVLEKKNTFTRMDLSFSQKVEDIVKADFPYKSQIIFGGIDNTKENLALMEIDMEAEDFSFFTKHITGYFYSDTATWQQLAQAVVQLDELMQKNNVDIERYSVSLEKEQSGSMSSNAVAVYDFDRELLKSDNLSTVMEEHFEKWTKNNKGV